MTDQGSGRVASAYVPIGMGFESSVTRASVAQRQSSVLLTRGPRFRNSLDVLRRELASALSTLPWGCGLMAMTSVFQTFSPSSILGCPSSTSVAQRICSGLRSRKRGFDSRSGYFGGLTDRIGARLQSVARTVRLRYLLLIPYHGWELVP